MSENDTVHPSDRTQAMRSAYAKNEEDRQNELEQLQSLFHGLDYIKEPWTLNFAQSRRSMMDVMNRAMTHEKSHQLMRLMERNPTLFEEWSWHLRGAHAVSFFVFFCREHPKLWLLMLDQSVRLMNNQQERTRQAGSRFRDLMTLAFQQSVSDRVFSDARLRELNFLLEDYQHE